jgi:hypothetical protein
MFHSMVFLPSHLPFIRILEMIDLLFLVRRLCIPLFLTYLLTDLLILRAQLSSPLCLRLFDAEADLESFEGLFGLGFLSAFWPVSFLGGGCLRGQGELLRFFGRCSSNWTPLSSLLPFSESYEFVFSSPLFTSCSL